MKMVTVLILVFTWPCSAHGSIAFDADGKWSTSFEYGAECVKHWQFYDEIGYCQDIVNDGIIWTGWPPSYNEHDPDMKLTSIVADAAHSGDYGARYWVFDGTNRQSPGITVEFPEPQPEFWIRYYLRYQEGFNWSLQHYEKQLYFRTLGSPALIPGMANGNFYVHSSGNTGSTNIYSSLTWNDHMGTPDNTSNGEWMCWEMYVKMDTDGTDGIVRLWIDGNLVLNRSDINHSGGEVEVRSGWTWFGFHSNQNEIDNSNGPIGADYAYVDYDDMVIYIHTPPNTDDNDIPFIGPMHADPDNDQEPGPPALTILAPEDGTVVNIAEVTVEGIVDPARPSTSVTVGGKPAAYDNGTFNATVNLIPGENDIVAIATDEEGRQGIASITVMYEPYEPYEPKEETRSGCSCSTNGTNGSLTVLFGAIFLLMLAVRVGRRNRNGSIIT